MGLKQIIKKISNKLDQTLMGDKVFVIVSNNCWGAEVYRNLDKEYNTPFVGLYLFGPDYIQLLERFDYYMSQSLQFVSNSKWIDGVNYPIGKLDDIEVHFMHYKSAEEATSKWTRRLARMNEITDRDKYYFQICDRDLITPAIIDRFYKLPFSNKISFGVKPFKATNHIVIAENKNADSVPDGLLLYKIGFKYVDVLKWIKTGKLSVNWYSKLKGSDSTL